MVKFCVGVIFLFTCFSGAFGFELSGIVVSVMDGDTVRVRDVTGRQQIVRLAEIDAPEKDQPWGSRSRLALNELVWKKTVRVIGESKDRYGRLVGKVYLGEVDVNRSMIGTGDAWVFTRYLKDSTLLEIEANAKRAAVGIWSLRDEDRIPPWIWRANKKSRVRAN